MKKNRDIIRVVAGKYRDQFDREHDCWIVLEETTIHEVRREERETGYEGVTATRYYCEDDRGRVFARTSDPISYGPKSYNWREQGGPLWEEVRTTKDGEKEGQHYDRDKPYVFPDHPLYKTVKTQTQQIAYTKLTPEERELLGS